VSVAATMPAVPAHVPPELVWNNSYPAFGRELADPWIATARLQNGPRLIWATDAGYGNPAWIPTRHELIRDAFLDFGHFSSIRTHNATSQLLGVAWRLNPLEVDPPLHHQYRQILNPFFSPRAVNSLGEAVRESCEALLAEFADAGSCEFIGAFASRFPAYIFLALLGMPRELLPQFLEWEHALLRGTDTPARADAARAIVGYLEGFLREQRIHPATELMKAIISGRIGDRPVDDNDILGTVFLLYIGGLDTVNSTLGWVVRHLAIDAGLQDRLREKPEDIPLAVEELTRAYAIASANRTVTADFTFHGVEMRKGDPVFLSCALANRDPLAFEDPHRIDIDRRARGSLSFATGPHHCLGVHLARREIRVVIETVLARLKGLRIQEGEDFVFHTGMGIGIDRLVLAWDAS
jgi:cytochrome P450